MSACYTCDVALDSTSRTVGSYVWVEHIDGERHGFPTGPIETVEVGDNCHWLSDDAWYREAAAWDTGMAIALDVARDYSGF